ncbi:glycosyltransferase family 39 protein [Kitasatospora sp. NPDC004240]
MWLWPTLVMAVVGGYRLETPELWRDEVATWSVVTRRPDDVLRLLKHVDASNGTYYLFMRGWTSVFGESVAALRLPSVLAMAAAAGFVTLAARRLYGGRLAAVAAGLLFATVPIVSRYAQEARSYAIVTCAVAAATWLLLRALDRPAAGRAAMARWAPYCVAMTVAGAGHLVAFSTVVGQAGAVLLWLRRARPAAERRVLAQFPLAVAAATLPLLPVVVLGSRQSGRQLGWITRPTAQELLDSGELLLGSRELYRVFLLLGVLALALPWRRVVAVTPLLLVVAPTLTVWLLSQAGGASYFTNRYLIFTVPAWALLAGGGVGAVHAAVTSAARRDRTPARTRTAGRERPDRQLRVAGVLLAVGVIAVPALLAVPLQKRVRYAGSHTLSQEPYRAAARLISAGYRPGDGLAAPLGNQAWAMTAEGVSYYLPADVRPYPVFVRRGAVEAQDLFPEPCPQPAECLGSGRRIWLLVLGDTPDPLGGIPVESARAALRAGFSACWAVPLGGATLALLERRDG